MTMYFKLTTWKKMKDPSDSFINIEDDTFKFILIQTIISTI